MCLLVAIRSQSAAIVSQYFIKKEKRGGGKKNYFSCDITVVTNV